MIKKILKITAAVLGLLIVLLLGLFLIGTRSVDRTPYFESAYYLNTCTSIDSLKKANVEVFGEMKAGFSRVSITPQLNCEQENFKTGQFKQVPLSGFGARKGAPASGIHDSIFVKAVAIKVKQKLIVFVGADLLIIPPNITDSVIAVLSKQGFSRDQLFFAATHTHSSLGAWGNGWVGEQFSGPENPSIEKWLVQQISKSVMQAANNLKPATLGTGSFNAGDYTRNRLIGERGTKNDDFSYIYLEQNDGKKAVIGSFSAHSTTLGDENLLISADYPGFWQRKMEAGSVDLALFFAGSMGSQTYISSGKGFEKTRFIGEALADSLGVYLKKTPLQNEISVSSVTLKMNLPDYNIRLTSKRNLATPVCLKINPLQDNNYLQAVRLGQTIWITTPSDFSGEFALQIKNNLKALGYEANVTSFNGSYLGYIIPGKYFYLDKYEPKTMGWFGPNMGDYTMDLIHQVTEIVR